MLMRLIESQYNHILINAQLLILNVVVIQYKTISNYSDKHYNIVL